MNQLRSLILGFIAFLFYRLMVWTWKIELHEPERLKVLLKNKKTFLLAHFHGDEAPLLYLAGKYKLSTMISTSRDGEIMNIVYRLLGGKPSRGSSTRGGVSALKGLLQLAKSGRGCNVSVDGPKGPIYEIKPGVFELSRLLNAEIFAGGAYCEDCWRFPKSWNQAYFPKPFSRVVIIWTGPFGPISKGEDPRSPELAKTLQNQLFDARHRAANLFGVSEPQR